MDSTDNIQDAKSLLIIIAIYIIKLHVISWRLNVTQAGLGNGEATTHGEVVFVHEYMQHPADKENGNSGPTSSNQAPVAQMSSRHLFQAEL